MADVIRGRGTLYRVLRVTPFQEYIHHKELGLGAVIIGLRLDLEGGRKLTLVNVPPEIAIAIERINHGDPPPDRQSLFDVLAYNEKFREVFGDILEKVVIDELNLSSGLYNAKAVFRSEGVSLQVTMIPSHAIFMALALDKPIFVAKELVDFEERSMENTEGDLDDDEDILFDIDDDGE